MSSATGWRETFSFLVNYTGVKENKIFSLKEECWVLEWIYVYDSISKLSATLSAMKENGGMDRMGNKANYCELKIKNPESRDILGQGRKYFGDSETFRFDIQILHTNYYSGAIEVSVTLGCDAPNKNTLLMSSLKSMQEEGRLTDFVIETEGAKIPCHKVLLAARSEYFKNMFETRMKESVENVLHWERVFDQSTVQDLLHFTYTGNKPPNISATCFSLVEAAHMCMMEDLKLMCVEEVIPAMTMDNALEVLVMGEKYDSEILKRTALNFMVDNFAGDVLELSGWDKVEPAMAKSLLASLIKILLIKKIKV